MHSVVLVTNLECFVRIGAERSFTFVQYKDTIMVPNSIQFFSLKEMRLNWKEHMFHTAALPTFNQTWRMVWRREDYVWEVREKLVSFSLVNPKDSSSRQWVIDWTGSLHEPRMVLYQWSNRPDHDCIYCVNLRRAQDANLVFRQRCSDAIIFLRQYASKRTGQFGNFCRRSYVRKKHTDFNQARGDSWRQHRLAHIRPTWRTLYSERETSKSLSHFQLDEASLEVSKQIDHDQRFDQELFKETCRKSRLLPCITSRFRNSCSTWR